MTALLQLGVTWCTAAGVICGIAVLLATGKGLFGLRVAVEFWTAAGLLRLAGPPSWQSLLAAAAILVLRQLLNFGLLHSPLRGENLRSLLAWRQPRDG